MKQAIAKTSLTPEEIIRYSRHLQLPEVDFAGQEKLKQSSVLIIGAGGLGNPVSLYLAAAGVGTIGILDFDKVDYSNLQRQVIFGVHDVGKSKVRVAANRLTEINPLSNIQVHECLLQSENATEIITNYDIVVDCTDNFPTRYLINDVCVKLMRPFIYGSIYRFDGQVSVFNFKGGPCYRCLYPKPPPPDLVPSCAEGGVLGVLPGIIGTLQANETLKVILEIGDVISSRLVLFEALSMEFTEMKLKKDEDCIVCSKSSEEISFIDYNQFCQIKSKAVIGSVPEISVEELNQKLSEKDDITIIDVRERYELFISHIEGALHIPVSEIPSQLDALKYHPNLAILCRSGIRSARICEYLINQGFSNVKNISGGINDWCKKVDPSQRQY